MSRFAGVKNNNIRVISKDSFVSPQYDTIEIPIELNDVSASDLIAYYKVRNGKFISKLNKKPASEIRLALVGNWKMQCGISTYSENLWPELIEGVGDFKLFIEKNEHSTGAINLIGNKSCSNEQVVACWARGEPLQDLVSEIIKYDPDIVLIQHEFGIWPNARHWLSLMSQLSDYRVIVTMHSVFHHLDKLIFEASMPEIIVHLDGAKDLLTIEKDLSNKIYVIPHGCYPKTNKKKLWNVYKSNKTFMQFGFGFRYKGWENSIKATAILKEKYPDVFFTGLFSESEFAKTEHQLYCNELLDLINKLGVQENVAILRGYQSELVIDSYLRTNQATIFPYISQPDHEVFGASGAARMAMSKGLPVVTSSINHFSDLPTIKADTPEQIALELEKIFTDSKLKDAQIIKQFEYIEENGWDKVAKKYLGVFEGK